MNRFLMSYRGAALALTIGAAALFGTANVADAGPIGKNALRGAVAGAVIGEITTGDAARGAQIGASVGAAAGAVNRLSNRNRIRSRGGRKIKHRR